MGVAQQAKVQEVIREWRADFDRARSSVVSTHWQYVDEIPSTGVVLDQVNWYWSSINGRMTKDKGQRTFHTATIHTMALTTERYRDGFRVDADDWLKPGIGDMMRNSVEDMGRWPANERVYVFHDFLLQGHTAAYGTTYDGQELFGTHPGKTVYGASTTYTNNFNLALTEANFITVRAAMRKYRPFTATHAPNQNATPHVIAGPDYEATLERMFNNQRTTSGADNELYRKATFEINQFLVDDDATTWFMFMEPPTPSGRPMKYHEAYPTQFLDIMDPMSKTYFDLHAYEFGINDRFGYGYNEWSSMARSKP